MIRTMTVVGTGLIGTSIGLAVSRHGVKVHLLDKEEVTARTAAALGAGVVGASDGPVDLAVAAVPPSAVGGVLAELQARGTARAYTDVASVKAQLAGDVRQSVATPAGYVGGHPVTAGERNGPLAARADLFEDRPWVLTPSETTSQDAVNRVLEMIAMCGAVPVIMDGRAHDDAVALTSHAPHVVASLMAARIQHGSPDSFRLAGQGLHDVMRMAVRDTGLWSDILRANAPAVAGVLRGLRDDLTTLLTTLDALSGVARSGVPQDDASRSLAPVADVLDRGAAGLAALRGWRAADRQAYVEVVVEEGPGQLVRLLDALKALHAEAEDVAPRYSTEEGRLSLTFAVPAVHAGRIVLELARAGWQAESVAAVAGPPCPARV
ncbi:prephenate dehydrogenase [Streptomyces sp. G44]|uniref:prephenate dehydrogenase n=1 Tax=Streptomyces sp. G44 TaxID=2807632 RepID=UPI00195FC19D|nr:prephenate dehydrogenase [Streptomyces sp. G44]MBM7172978.1 prephenate dehydrogenase [Streptomyces sp. G44]